MDELLGRSKNFWLSAVALIIILFLVGMVVLPKLFIAFVHNKNEVEYKEVDYHSSLTFDLNKKEKMGEIENIFSDLFSKGDFKKINVVVTDIPQKNKVNWVDDHGKIVNHLGYDAILEEDNLNVYIYNNAAAFSYRGWDVEKIARENEILLIKALMYYRGWSVHKINNEASKVYISLHERYPEPLFLMTYDL